MQYKLKLYISLISLLILFSNCGNRPSYVLDEDEMVDLLVDMQLSEAYMNTTSSSSKDKLDIGKRVLEKHGVSEESLDTTLAWYGRNMDEYSKLFDKVDKEILKRKEKFLKEQGQTLKVSGNLWSYNPHLVISPLSGYDNFSFTLPKPEIEKGDLIKMSFYLANRVSMKGNLGVEYNDGYGESVNSNFSGSNNKIEIELQTDTAKEISKIFGSFQLKDIKLLPVYIDSISIITESMDSLTYRSKRRSQKGYGILRPQIKEIKKTPSNTIKELNNELKDSLENKVAGDKEKKSEISKREIKGNSEKGVVLKEKPPGVHRTPGPMVNQNLQKNRNLK